MLGVEERHTIGEAPEHGASGRRPMGCAAIFGIGLHYLLDYFAVGGMQAGTPRPRPIGKLRYRRI